MLLTKQRYLKIVREKKTSVNIPDSKLLFQLFLVMSVSASVQYEIFSVFVFTEIKINFRFLKTRMRVSCFKRHIFFSRTDKILFYIFLCRFQSEKCKLLHKHAWI